MNTTNTQYICRSGDRVTAGDMSPPVIAPLRARPQEEVNRKPLSPAVTCHRPDPQDHNLLTLLHDRPDLLNPDLLALLHDPDLLQEALRLIDPDDPDHKALLLIRDRPDLLHHLTA
jgi:hypothetical protein